jgi:hypothetical protein
MLDGNKAICSPLTVWNVHQVARNLPSWRLLIVSVSVAYTLPARGVHNDLLQTKTVLFYGIEHCAGDSLARGARPRATPFAE